MVYKFVSYNVENFVQIDKVVSELKKIFEQSKPLFGVIVLIQEFKKEKKDEFLKKLDIPGAEIVSFNRMAVLFKLNINRPNDELLLHEEIKMIKKDLKLYSPEKIFLSNPGYYAFLCIFELNGKKVFVVNIHLDALIDMFSYSFRNDQLNDVLDKSILQYLNPQSIHKPEYIVIGGDTNRRSKFTSKKRDHLFKSLFSDFNKKLEEESRPDLKVKDVCSDYCDVFGTQRFSDINEESWTKSAVKGLAKIHLIKNEAKLDIIVTNGKVITKGVIPTESSDHEIITAGIRFGFVGGRKKTKKKNKKYSKKKKRLTKARKQRRLRR